MFKGLWGPKNREDGFTLLEIIIVIAIMGFLAAMIVPFAGHLNKSKRIKLTEEKLESVRAAILGPENTYSQGLRVIGGYVGDTGKLPKLYPSSWNNTDKTWDWLDVDEMKYGEGQPRALWEKETAGENQGEDWKPYLLKPRDPYPGDTKNLDWNLAVDRDLIKKKQVEGKLSDAWGRVLYFIKEGSEPNIDLLIISSGPDGEIKLPDPADPDLINQNYNPDATDNRDNIFLKIRHTEWAGVNQKYLEEETRRRLESIRTALLGPPDAFDPSGRRIVGGYIGDMGQWPKLWKWNGTNKWQPVTIEEDEETVGQPRGLWEWDKDGDEGYSDHMRNEGDEPIGFSWRGPYLPKPWGKGEGEVLTDAWGTPLHFVLDKVADPANELPKRLRVISAGRDKVLGTADDLEISDHEIEEEKKGIRTSDWVADAFLVRGLVVNVVNVTPRKYVKKCMETNEDGDCISYQWEPAPDDEQLASASVKITLHHRPGEPPLETPVHTVKPGTDLSVVLQGKFYAGSRLLVVEVNGTVTYRKEIFIGASGTQSPPAEKLVFTVESPPS